MKIAVLLMLFAVAAAAPAFTPNTNLNSRWQRFKVTKASSCLT
jgi:hypothetical protein